MRQIDSRNSDMTQVVPSAIIEIAEAGLEAHGEPPAEVLRWLGGLRDLLRQPGRAETLARAIHDHLLRHAREAGICPHCGADLVVVSTVERHPAPFGWGTATEQRRQTYCPHCERHELAAARRAG